MRDLVDSDSRWSFQIFLSVQPNILMTWSHCTSVLLCPIHTGEKVEFNTVDFVESRKSTVSLWPRRLHTGNKVDRISNKVDRDKLSNSRCCMLICCQNRQQSWMHRQQSWTYTATVDSVADLLTFVFRRRTKYSYLRSGRQQSTFNKVDRVEFNFVASVYRA